MCICAVLHLASLLESWPASATGSFHAVTVVECKLSWALQRHKTHHHGSLCENFLPLASMPSHSYPAPPHRRHHLLEEAEIPEGQRQKSLHTSNRPRIWFSENWTFMREFWGQTCLKTASCHRIRKLLENHAELECLLDPFLAEKIRVVIQLIIELFIVVVLSRTHLHGQFQLCLENRDSRNNTEGMRRWTYWGC